VLYEKRQDFQIIVVDMYNKPKTSGMNPYNRLPVLASGTDIYEANINQRVHQVSGVRITVMPADQLMRARARLFCSSSKWSSFPTSKRSRTEPEQQDRARSTLPTSSADGASGSPRRSTLGTVLDARRRDQPALVAADYYA